MVLELLEQIFENQPINETDTLLIVPPFIRLNNASLGVHILQACAKAAGQRVLILYANQMLAKLIGKDIYNAITFSSDIYMWGDRVFANAAYGLPALGRDVETELAGVTEEVRIEGGKVLTLSTDKLYDIAHQASHFATQLGAFVAAKNFRCVGCTSMFKQTGAAVAFLNQIKIANPKTITIIGGANCAGGMAKGIASLSPRIDYIFSGESESVFVNFLNQIDNGEKPDSRIINGPRCDDLDAIPTTDFSEYYHQANICQTGLDWSTVHMPYESSRGCWWGQKHHCTFCGVHEMNYRMKSADRVIEQLGELLKKHPSDYVNFTDDIMPLPYFKTLLPRLATELPELKFFIDQKATLTLEKVKLLVTAGAYDILPGIETLSTPLLDAVDKGVKARQNIQLMRYAKSCGLFLSWYFLHGIPGEKVEYYQEFLTLLPKITHLHPPVFFQELQLHRFGLYVTMPEQYGIKNLVPATVYRGILPETADVDNVAYYFNADYPSLRSQAPDVMAQMYQLVANWRAQWYDNDAKPPKVEITAFGADQYMLTDTRKIITKP
ncbi:MAG: RiPP maturation radical SAM C-methyltransferase, partial [Psychrosphaera sp.]|nr:RiPP maturation radical SAM C-methyltransferase [Psychrosphaera sp.]